MTESNFVIADICDFSGGSQPDKKHFRATIEDGYVRLIQTRDYKTSAFKTYVPENLVRRFCDTTDVMIGRYGPPIFQIFRGLSGAYNVALMKASPKPGVSKDFVYYYLKQRPVFEYVDKLSARTGGQTGVDLVSLRKYPVPEKALNNQGEIAAVLSALDAKIELNQRINAQLEAMAKTLYDYWFVQFDFPNEQGEPYKSSGGKMVYNATLKRKIPVDWTHASVTSVSKCVRRGFSPKYIESGGVSVLNQKCVREHKVLFEHGRRLSNNLDESDSRRLELLDVLVNSTGVGTLGRVAFLRRLKEEITTVDSHVTIVRCDKKKIAARYFAYSMLRLQPHIERAAEGSTGQVELRRTQLEELPLVLPSKASMQAFDKFTAPIDQQITKGEQQNHHLTQLRDWLLPMLMNGQVTVGD